MSTQTVFSTCPREIIILRNCGKPRGFYRQALVVKYIYNACGVGEKDEAVL